MSSELPEIGLRAIGVVRSRVKEPPPAGYPWHNEVSEIAIEANLTQALDGLEDFSHIIVLYWTHRAAGGELAPKIHPMGNPELPLVGRLATRSPSRPNRIALSTARLLQRQANILKVQGLDALDGSPVIDIKPYIPGSDSPPDARVPQWVPR